MRRPHILALAALGLALIASMPAEARLDYVEHDTDAFQGPELVMYQVFPDVPIPVGNDFVWTVTAFSGVSQMDEVNFTGTKVGGDCHIIDQTNNTFTPTFVETNITIRITGPACYMEVGASAVDGGVLGVGDTEAHGHLSANVVSFTMHDIGQDSNASLSSYAGPLLLAGAVFLIAWWRGLFRHPAWGLLVVVGFITVLTELLGNDMPAAVAIPAHFGAIGLIIMALVMYVVGRMGFAGRRGRED